MRIARRTFTASLTVIQPIRAAYDGSGKPEYSKGSERDVENISLFMQGINQRGDYDPLRPYAEEMLDQFRGA